MTDRVVDRCPNCDLVIRWGNILEASEDREQHGPILGLSDDVDPDTARAGYVGLGSLWLGGDPSFRDLYRCPRCRTNCLIESSD